MRLKLAAVLATCLMLEVHAPHANACGVKLTVTPTGPRKAVARTSNPSQVLIVGAPPRRLSNDLSVAGHKVEVVDDVSGAKRDKYGVVIVDNDKQASAAREKFGNSVVIVRSGNVRDDEKAVEDRVRPTVVAAATKPDVVAAREGRPVVAAGPDRGAPKEIITAKQPDATPVADLTPPTPTPPTPTPPTPTPKEPKAIATTATPKDETPATPKTPKGVADRAELHEEIFFSRVGSKNVARNGALDRAVTWLTANSAANVTLEGYADPTGTHEGNMTLSEGRADSVKEYLVAKGIDAGRIEVKPLGDTQLKYGAKDGRNRRVAISATK
ncbi:MAG TPA: OmpA family protein [Kofleriaceae bacterium]|jgi:outer membrane protein OmpA-like peptidoglycan-associated protein